MFILTYVKPHLEFNIEKKIYISHHNLLHSGVKENVNKARQTDERICDFSLIREAEESLSLSSSSSGWGLFLKLNVYLTEPAKRKGLVIYISVASVLSSVTLIIHSSISQQKLKFWLFVICGWHLKFNYILSSFFLFHY